MWLYVPEAYDILSDCQHRSEKERRRKRPSVELRGNRRFGFFEAVILEPMGQLGIADFRRERIQQAGAASLAVFFADCDLDHNRR
jgi:hypothetical protein